MIKTLREEMEEAYNNWAPHTIPRLEVLIKIAEKHIHREVRKAVIPIPPPNLLLACSCNES